MQLQCHFHFIILTVLSVITVFALSVSNAEDELFKSMDENGDGKITLGEFSEDMKEQAFEQLDADHDKTIEKEEWKGHEKISDEEQHVELFESIDKDEDKRINFFEFSDYADRKSNIDEAFIGLDKDGSNSLSPDEITVRPLFKMITIKF